MMFRSGIQRLRGRRTHAHPVLDQTLLQLGPKAPWSWRDACQHVAIMGSSGSGKTSSSARMVMQAFMAQGAGGLVLTAKATDRHQLRSWAAEVGREDSLLFVDGSGDYRFNALEHALLTRPAGQTSIGLAELLLELSEIADECNARGDAIWKSAKRELISSVITVLLIAHRDRLRMEDLSAFLGSIPATPQQASDPAWQTRSACWASLNKANQQEISDAQRKDLAAARDLFLETLPGYDHRTCANILFSVNTALSMFTRDPLRTLFTTDTNVCPELCYGGAIIVLDMPVQSHGAIGRLAQMLFARCFMDAVEAREISDGTPPVFLFIDECPLFVSERLSRFVNCARTARCATVLVAQSISAIYAGMGRSSQTYHHDAENLLGGTATKILHANNCPVTNEWACRLLGQSWRSHASSSGTTDPKHSTQSSTHGVSEALGPQVTAAELSSLVPGGSHMFADALVTQAGRVFSATGRNFMRLRFPQA